MNRTTLITLVLCAGLAWMADALWAHGGSYRGPNGGIPPGAREPADPEPPPPGPSDPGTPGTPVTPGEPSPGPTTDPEHGGPTPGEAPPPPVPLRPNRPTRPNTPLLSFESWRYWWAYNNADILNLKSHIFATKLYSSDPRYYASGRDEQNKVDARRPTIAAIEKSILPALLACINRAGDHDDVHGGSIIAIGKDGNARFIPLLDAILNGTYTSDKGRRIRFGPQATESAALALGLLPDLDESAKEAVRRVCIAAIGNEKLRRRDRAWAAVSLGFQRDRGAVDALVGLLQHKYADDNIPCAILAALGLIGDDRVAADLTLAFTKGDLYGRDVTGNDRIRAFAGYAIARIGDLSALDAVQAVLRSRRAGRIVKRSAAIAAGVLGAKANDERRKDVVKSLLAYMSGARGDNSGVNFACIALSQVATPRALNKLLELCENGKYSQRPFAALGLATRVWYTDRAAEKHAAEPMDRKLRERIVDKLRRLSERFKDGDTRAALMLCRGLVKDKTAIDGMVRIVARRSAPPVLRGYCCVALGLLGDAREDVKDALRLALSDRRREDMRRNAATGLGLLHDSQVVRDMIEALEKAKSFAVQGQLITAIGTIGDHTAIAPLRDLLEDRGRPDQTRAMAAVGLGMIGDLQEIPTLSRLAKNYNYRASVRDIDELLFIL